MKTKTDLVKLAASHLGIPVVDLKLEPDTPPFKEVQFWYVKGVPQTLYDNKLRAERAARLAFPDEDADKRYARVFFKTFYEEV
jgi:hypothetical protein